MPCVKRVSVFMCDAGWTQVQWLCSAPNVHPLHLQIQCMDMVAASATSWPSTAAFALALAAASSGMVGGAVEGAGSTAASRGDHATNAQRAGEVASTSRLGPHPAGRKVLFVFTTLRHLIPPALRRLDAALALTCCATWLDALCDVNCQSHSTSRVTSSACGERRAAAHMAE